MRFSLKQRLRLKKRPSNVSDFSLPYLTLSFKVILALIPLLLLPYSSNTKALSATTANTIQGAAPYLTFDSGTTKVTTTDGLLGIKLSDGSTPMPNSPTPITLPAAGETFADIEMLMPPSAPPVSAADPTQKINLNALIGAPYNYWGDDDGDGQGAAGITATGSLSVVITDKNGKRVNRSNMPNVCNAPYKVVLTSTAGSLSTKYGDPSSSAFTAANATYLINPTGPAVCFAKPNLNYNNPMSSSMWNGTKGFITQSTTPATYGQNFPTTGANQLYFDLDISGSAIALDWTSVTSNGITVAPDPATLVTATSVRYKLTGPTTVVPSGTFSTTGATFELEGKTGGTTVVKYGFTIKKWFAIDAGGTQAAITLSCNTKGYRQVRTGEMSNANTYSGFGLQTNAERYKRVIGAGLGTEWGALDQYTGAGWYGTNYNTIEQSYPTTSPLQIYPVDVRDGTIRVTFDGTRGGICVYP